MPDEDFTSAQRDPGDGVPPGVAPISPVPLSEADKKVLEKLEKIGNPDAGHPKSH